MRHLFTATLIGAAPAAPSTRMAGNAAADVAQQEAPLRRYLAVRHVLGIQTDAQQVESAWRQANEACVAAGCEVLNSTLMRDGQRRPANAQLEARVPPDKLEAFLVQASALGSVGQHSKTAEDKTDKVHVTLSFTARPSVLETGVWSPVSEAVTGAGRMLAHSVGGLITFVVAVLPWALALLALGAGVRALWRRRRARIAGAA